MKKLLILAGDYPKGNAYFDAVSISVNRSWKLPRKLYFIDIESYIEDSSGTIELHFFDGKRILVEKNAAFLKALKTALFDQPQDVEVRRKQWQERQNKGGTKVKSPITLSKVIIFLFVCVVALAVIGNLVSKPGTSTHAYIEENKSEQAASKVSDDILNFRYTKAAYPKLYRRWGDTAMAKINELMPKAALHVARERSCDRVEGVDLSEARSKPKSHIVFFVDCANKNRFFVSEAEINSNAAVTAEQDKEIDNLAAIRVCDDAIKANLQHPGTFSQHFTDTSVSVNPNGNIIVIRGFSAKNGLGNEIDYRARCVLSPDYQIADGDLNISQK